MDKEMSDCRTRNSECSSERPTDTNTLARFEREVDLLENKRAVLRVFCLKMLDAQLVRVSDISTRVEPTHISASRPVGWRHAVSSRLRLLLDLEVLLNTLQAISYNDRQHDPTMRVQRTFNFEHVEEAHEP